jgi:hypothetical protein
MVTDAEVVTLAVAQVCSIPQLRSAVPGRRSAPLEIICSRGSQPQDAFRKGRARLEAGIASLTGMFASQTPDC